MAARDSCLLVRKQRGARAAGRGGNLKEAFVSTGTDTRSVCREVQGDANSTCVVMAAEQIASSVRVRHRPVEVEKVATQRSSQPGSAKQRGGLAGVEQRLRVEPHKYDGRGRSQRDVDLRGDQAK